MEFFGLDWSKNHILKTNTRLICEDIEDELNIDDIKREVEPWLSAIFQSEHLSILIGSGLSSSVTAYAGVKSQGMWRLDLENEFKDLIQETANKDVLKSKRGEANIEDDIRVSLELLKGLNILKDKRAEDLEKEINSKFYDFITGVLTGEREFRKKLESEESNAITSFNLLKSFILSFTGRAASRERLHIFTTNYDRFIELACDETGVLLLDRFKGKLKPIFRNTRLELDFHYNPPGIRGEPRYVEGVARLTKLHGSLDWRFENGHIVKNLLPFGVENDHPGIPKEITDKVVIFPNSSKDIETSFYPYAELFRDFSASICKPNSVMLTYGYGFGDSHINRVIEDMLTIPSTHLVIIAWDKNYADKTKPADFGGGRRRIVEFLKDKNSAQITLLIGSHFGDLNNLVEHYLPKSAIDRLTIKMQKLKSNRGDITLAKENEETLKPEI